MKSASGTVGIAVAAQFGSRTQGFKASDSRSIEGSTLCSLNDVAGNWREPVRAIPTPEKWTRRFLGQRDSHIHAHPSPLWCVV